MKKLIAIVSVLALQASPAMAWVGGPWSAGTHDNHVTGIFGGMITMKNGSGIFRFSSDESAQLGAFNSSMIYYKGRTFLGSCQAHLDFDAKKVVGITNGSAYDRSPTQRRNQTSPLNDNDPNYTGGATTTSQISIPLSPVVSEDGEVTPRTYTLSNINATGSVGIANTNWQGKITSTAPNIRFSASGEAAFLGAESQVFRITVREGETEDPLIPGPLEEVSFDYGSNDPFPKPANVEKIKVIGSRVSYNTVASIGGLNNSITGTGGGAFNF